MTTHVREVNLLRIIVALFLCTLRVQICATIEAEIDLDVEGNGFHRLEIVVCCVNKRAVHVQFLTLLSLLQNVDLSDTLQESYPG